MMQFILCLLCLAFVGKVAAYSGVDLSQRTYSSSFNCMVNSGYNFAIVRIYQSNGHPDPNAAASINDAWAGGMSYVDGYIFPCYSCGNPAQQVKLLTTQYFEQTYNFLKIFFIEHTTDGRCH